ncbi:Elongator subunit elp2 [Entophlyctis luteolus]|nr:Elongator subunit elp2 [Entophlyctis luteolus]
MRAFISAPACNQASQAADTAFNLLPPPEADAAPSSSQPQLVAFAAHHSVALFHSTSKSDSSACDPVLVNATLQGHSLPVVAVRFLRRSLSAASMPCEVALVSASADCSLRVWKRDFSHPKGLWKTSAVLNGHTAPICALGVPRGRKIVTPNGRDLIVSAATDGTVRVWERQTSDAAFEDSVECVQTIKTGPRYVLAACVGLLPNTDIPVLFVAGCDCAISLYLRDSQTGQFAKVLSLQGHTDWIRDLDLATFTSAPFIKTPPGYNDGDVMLASASQDKYVRLWKVSEASSEKAGNSSLDSQDSSNSQQNQKSDFDDAIEMLEALVGEDSEGGMQLSTKAHIIEVLVGENKRKFTVMFDALLIGHEDWVHSVTWAPPIVEDNQYVQKLEIISASADKSVSIWRPDVGHVWTVDVRLGEVGGSSFGFYGAKFGANSSWILAHGYHGAIQIWDCHGVKGDAHEFWEPRVGLSGHFRAVQDLTWNESGDFLISTSLDQTSRLWGEWKREGKSSWHEIARPQIHGYDLNCIAMIHKYGFVSGADEKIIRVFEASRTFLESLKHISGISESPNVMESLPVGAAVSALGLSNKAILPGAPIDTNAQLIFEPLAPETINAPPSEQYLMQHTLWPEINKL